MYTLTNKVNRSIALPSPLGTVVLEVGEKKTVSDDRYAELLKSRYTKDALNAGAYKAVHSDDSKPKKARKKATQKK